MTAKILSFSRPAEPTIPVPAPPLPVVSYAMRWSDGTLVGCEIIGTKESLVAWRVATDGEFPQGRKRIKHNGWPRPTIQSLGAGWKGSYRVSFHFAANQEGQQAAEPTKDLVEEIQRHCKPFENDASKCMSGLWSLRQALFFPGSGRRIDYDNAQLAAFDDLVSRLKNTVVTVLVHNQQQRTSCQSAQ